MVPDSYGLQDGRGRWLAGATSLTGAEARQKASALLREGLAVRVVQVSHRSGKVVAAYERDAARDLVPPARGGACWAADLREALRAAKVFIPPLQRGADTDGPCYAHVAFERQALCASVIGADGTVSWRMPGVAAADAPSEGLCLPIGATYALLPLGYTGQIAVSAAESPARAPLVLVEVAGVRAHLRAYPPVAWSRMHAAL